MIDKSYIEVDYIYWDESSPLDNIVYSMINHVIRKTIILYNIL